MRWNIRVLTGSAVVVCLAVLVAHGQVPKPGPPQNSLEVLQQRVAALEKEVQSLKAELGALRAQVQRSGSTQASNDGARFIGNWQSIKSADSVSISKDGDKYVVNDSGGGKFVCELSGGSLKSGTAIGNVDFLASSGHIVWRGMELAKVRAPGR